LRDLPQSSAAVVEREGIALAGRWPRRFFCDKNGRVTRVPYREYFPPDVTAGIFWMKNRRPDLWRDTHQIEHQLGKYVISDHPMTAEEWPGALT
jgi:hypothetical protein